MSTLWPQQGKHWYIVTLSIKNMSTLCMVVPAQHTHTHRQRGQRSPWWRRQQNRTWKRSGPRWGRRKPWVMKSRSWSRMRGWDTCQQPARTRRRLVYLLPGLYDYVLLLKGSKSLQYWYCSTLVLPPRVRSIYCDFLIHDYIITTLCTWLHYL